MRALLLALMIAACGAPAASTAGTAPQPATIAGAVAATAELSMEVRELI